MNTLRLPAYSLHRLQYSEGFFAHEMDRHRRLPMDINDSAGIKALLEQLESSSAWQDTIGSSTSPPDDHLQHAVHPSQSLPAPQLSVSELLSQLQPEHNQMAVDPQDSAIGIRTHTPQSSASVKSSVNHDRTFEGYRSSTFQQALSLIASVSDNPSFGDSLKSMKKEQDDLETKLSNERKAILSKYEAKVQVAKTKASIISTGLSKHEANMLSAALVKELKQFDLERALPAWDGLVLKQEERLAQLGLPDTLFKAEVSERKKIMQVLEGFI
ncbi:hypothetical protein F5880DRAFT_890861 [Lentinula raphanica]|nr:hypothetical protein F5880DRAFT_890861 [Lentinula raphanica]